MKKKDSVDIDSKPKSNRARRKMFFVIGFAILTLAVFVVDRVINAQPDRIANAAFSTYRLEIGESKLVAKADAIDRESGAIDAIIVVYNVDDSIVPKIEQKVIKKKNLFMEELIFTELIVKTGANELSLEIGSLYYFDNGKILMSRKFSEIGIELREVGQNGRFSPELEGKIRKTMEKFFESTPSARPKNDNTHTIEIPIRL